MSDGQRSRRRFLADLLFLGGAVGAGAFLSQAGDAPAAQAATPSPAPITPESTPVPSKTQCPPMVRGEVMASPPPVVEGEPRPSEPVLGGKPTAPSPTSPSPQPRAKGDVVIKNSPEVP